MKVLVTGARGMLGAGVALKLAERGDAVTVLQRHPSGLGLREVLADVADTAVVRQAVVGQDAVVHLAAKVNVVGPWAEYERVNIGGTRAIVDGCRAAGVRRLVYVSSPSVAHAGRSLVGVGAGPADPISARGPYARSKAVAEQLALAADEKDLAVVAVRPHLVWGPGDTQLIARIVDRARRRRLPRIGTGAALVDTTYVTNAVDALIAALDGCVEARRQAVVISNGEPRPIGELITAICRAAGAPPPPSFRVPVPLALAAGSAIQTAWAAADRALPGRLPPDPPITRFLVEQLSTAHWFDQRRTRELLHWHPTVSIDEGLAELRRFYLGWPDVGR